MTVITESTKDTLGQMLAKRALQSGYTTDDAPALAAIFTEVGDYPAEVVQEFTDEMNRRRLDEVRASFVSTPAKQAWARKVLDTHARYGCTAPTEAAIAAWPGGDTEPEAEAEPGPAKTCMPKAKRSRAAAGPRSRRTGIRPARLAGGQ